MIRWLEPRRGGWPLLPIVVAIALFARGAWAEPGEGAGAANVAPPGPTIGPAGPIAGATVVASALLAGHEDELSGCYGKALAVDSRRQGALDLHVESQRLTIDRDDIGGPGFDGFEGCLRAIAAHLGAPSGSGHASFAPPARPGLVRVADAPLRGPLRGKMHAQILLDPANAGAPGSLLLLTLDPGAELPLHVHPAAAELLYLLRGHLRIGGAGGSSLDLPVGGAVYLRAGVPHSIRSTGGRGVPAVLLELYAPGGPERRLVDAAAPSGTRLVTGPAARATSAGPIALLANGTTIGPGDVTLWAGPLASGARPLPAGERILGYATRSELAQYAPAAVPLQLDGPLVVLFALPAAPASGPSLPLAPTRGEK